MTPCYPCYVEERNTYEDVPLTPTDIAEIVSKHSLIPFHDMITKSRKHENVVARRIAMTLIRDQTKLGLKEIGELMGGRDHTTVLVGIREIKDLLETDSSVENLFTTICQNLPVKFSLFKWKPRQIIRFAFNTAEKPPTEYSNKSAYGIAR